MFRISPGSLGCLRESRGSSQSTRNDVLFLGRMRWIWKNAGLLIHRLLSFMKTIRYKYEYYFFFSFDKSLKQKKRDFTAFFIFLIALC